MNQKNQRFSGYVMATCACAFSFFVGNVVGAYATFLPAISVEMGAATTTLSFSTTFMAIATIVVGMFIAPRAFKNIGVRVCYLVSGICVILSNLIMSFSTAPWQIFVSAGLLCGVMMGMGNQSALGAIVSNWFYEGRARVTGIFLAISTFGATFYITLSGFLLDHFSYHLIYRVYAIIALVVTVVVILVVRDKPEQKGQQIKGYEQMQKDLAEAAAKGTETPELPGLSAGETRKTACFWIQYIAILFCGVALFSSTTYIVTLYVQVGGLLNSRAALISSVLSVATAIVMATNPFIRKKLGAIPYYILSAILTCAGMCLHAAFAPTAASHYWLCFVAAILLAFGGIRGTLDAQNSAAELYGMRDYAGNQAFLLTGVQMGNLFMAVLYTGMINGGLNTAQCYYVYAALFLVGSVFYIIAHLINPMKKKNKNLNQEDISS